MNNTIAVSLLNKIQVFGRYILAADNIGQRVVLLDQRGVVLHVYNSNNEFP